MTIDYESGLSGPTDDQLETISALAHKQIKLQLAFERAEDAYKQAKKDLANIQEKELPEAMLAVGMEKFQLKTGEMISVKETLYASLSQANRPNAIKWLMDNDHGSIVKEIVNVTFEKGEHEYVEKLVEVLEKHGFNTYNVDENVNTATVKSLIKELLGQGVEVPLELFGAYFARKAVVKL